MARAGETGDSTLPLVIAGAAAAWFFWPQIESLFGITPAAAVGTPVNSSPLTTNGGAPQQTNNSPITSATPGATTTNGSSTYNSGVTGSGPITNTEQGSPAPTPGPSYSGCPPNYSADASGICTLYTDQILLAQVNSIPWTGSGDIPNEQINRIDQSILNAYTKYPGITPGTVLAYMLGLGATGVNGSIANGADGKAYQMINGVWVSQGTSTGQTQPIIPVPATGSVIVASTTPGQPATTVGGMGYAPLVTLIQDNTGAWYGSIGNAPPNTPFSVNQNVTSSPPPPGFLVGSTGPNGGVSFPFPKALAAPKAGDYWTVGIPPALYATLALIPYSAATQMQPGTTKVIAPPAATGTLNQQLAQTASQIAMANASAAAAAVNPYAQVVAAQDCGPQPPSDNMTVWNAWYSCYYASQGPVGQAALGAPAKLNGVPSMNANGLHRLRGVVPVNSEMLQAASHNADVATLIGRDPRAMLNANQWNYYYGQATGELQTAALHPPGFPHALMSAADYQLARKTNGLPVTLAQNRLAAIRNSAPGMFPLGGIGNGPDRVPYLPPPNRNIYRIPGRGATTKLGVLTNGGGNHRWARSPFPRPAQWREAE